MKATRVVLLDPGKHQLVNRLSARVCTFTNYSCRGFHVKESSPGSAGVSPALRGDQDGALSRSIPIPIAVVHCSDGPLRPVKHEHSTATKLRRALFQKGTHSFLVIVGLAAAQMCFSFAI